MEKEDLIKKWLKEDLSPEEKKLFEDIEESPFFEEIILEAKRFKANEQIKAAPFSVLESRLEDDHKDSSKHWIRIVSGIAAVFVVGIGLFYLLTKNQFTTVTTIIAQKENITLPDKSLVILNELSKISYSSSSDWDHKRSINLDGEAFFDVEKGKKFDVITEKGVVTVLGTEFNIKSRDAIFIVTCYEGLVQVSHNDHIVLLPAGNQYQLLNGVSEKSSINITEPFWLQKMSVFERTPLSKVLIELEKSYTIKIDFSSADSTMLFTGAFEHDNLENALKAITEPLNLTYIIEPNQKVIIRNVQK